MRTGLSNTFSNRFLEDRPGGLMLVVTLGLTLFYYGTRADTIGVFSGAGWTPMTGRPLSVGYHGLAALILLGALPLIAVLTGTSARPGELGLGCGRRKLGLLWVVVGVPAAVFLAKLAAGNPGMGAVYPLDRALVPQGGPFAVHALKSFLYYGTWELLFRGVLLFGLQRNLGFASANAIQTAFSVLAHFGRPFPETMAALPAGLAFGGVARQTRSIWYVAIIHWTAGMAQDWFLLTG